MKNNKSNIPVKTAERILLYRTILNELNEQGEEYITSHELSKYTNTNNAQIRKDISMLPFQGHTRKGYNITNLLEVINKTFKLDEEVKAAIIGMGKLGSAISGYFNNHISRFKINIAFDIDEFKVGKTINNCKIYSMNQIINIIEKEKISFVILTIPDKAAQHIVNILSETEIKGILNFSSIPIKTKNSIIVNKIDITLEMEKLFFYSH